MENGGSVWCRFKSVAIPPGVPRIFLSNEPVPFHDPHGANVLGSEEMQAKAAFLWSLWAFVYGTELNVKADASKSAMSSMRYVRVPGPERLRGSPGETISTF